MSALTDDVRGYFTAPNIGHVATLLPDGSPHVAPVWVGVRGDTVVFLTDPASRKGRNLARDPRVSISVTRADMPNSAAAIRGRVVDVRSDDEGWAIIDGLADDYIGQPYPLRTDRAAYVVEVDSGWAQTF